MSEEICSKCGANLGQSHFTEQHNCEVDKQLEIREYLAKAMGWIETYSGKWTSRSDGLGGFRFEPPDPFTSADDLLELVEWTRKQEWFMGRHGNRGNIVIGPGACRIVIDDRRIGFAEGPFQEAFPLAVYQALRGMKMDALEHMERFAAHGGLLMAPEDMEALRSIVSELRAAREAVENQHEPFDRGYQEGWNDALNTVAEKMKEARNG